MDENIGGRGKTKKLTTFFSRAPQNTRQNYQINHSNPPKKRPLYNCLLVLLLHTAAVTKYLGGTAQVWGEQLPSCPDVKPPLIVPFCYVAFGI